jgi:hypothetical protein
MVRKTFLAVLVALVTSGAGVSGSQAFPIAPVQTGVGGVADGVQLAYYHGHGAWHGHRYHYRHGSYRYYHGGWWYPSPWWTLGYSGYYVAPVAPVIGIGIGGVGVGIGVGHYGHGHYHCYHHKCHY